MVKEHLCLNGEWISADVYWVNDGRGIPLALVCNKCKSSKLSKYRQDIMTHYDTDEQVEDDY